jgi:ectoine hydroxylase-related dioxygenase (phytanoyl-CoA dioxygenase family)
MKLRSELLNNGYFIARNLIDDNQLQILEKEFEMFFNRYGIDSQIIPEPHNESIKIFNIISSKNILSSVKEALHTDEISFISSWMYYKPPGSLGRDAHQDAFYNHIEKNKGINFSIALDSADKDNGGVWVVDGSSELDLLPIEVDEERLKTNPSSGRAMFDRGKECKIPDNLSKKYLTLNQGDCLGTNGYIIHGSGDNITYNRWRRSLIITYIESGTKFTRGRADKVEIKLKNSGIKKFKPKSSNIPNRKITVERDESLVTYKDNNILKENKILWDLIDIRDHSKLQEVFLKYSKKYNEREGWSLVMQDDECDVHHHKDTYMEFFKHLHDECDKYNIQGNKVHLVQANFLLPEFYESRFSNIENKINVYETFYSNWSTFTLPENINFKSHNYNSTHTRLERPRVHLRPKHFLSLNAHYCDHREWLADILYMGNISREKSFFSFQNGDVILVTPEEIRNVYIQNKNKGINIFEDKLNYPTEDLSPDKLRDLKKLVKKGYKHPIMIEEEFDHGTSYLYENSYINIVTESASLRLEEWDQRPVGVLTEKTFRPLLNYQFSIYISSHGILNHLQQFGFKTFNGIIDESYDKIKGWTKRSKKLEDEIRRLSELPIEELHDRYINNLEVLVHNKKMMEKLIKRGKNWNLIVDKIKNYEL